MFVNVFTNRSGGVYRRGSGRALPYPRSTIAISLLLSIAWGCRRLAPHGVAAPGLPCSRRRSARGARFPCHGWVVPHHDAPRKARGTPRHPQVASPFCCVRFSFRPSHRALAGQGSAGSAMFGAARPSRFYFGTPFSYGSTKGLVQRTPLLASDVRDTGSEAAPTRAVSPRNVVRRVVCAPATDHGRGVSHELTRRSCGAALRAPQPGPLARISSRARRWFPPPRTPVRPRSVLMQPHRHAAFCASFRGEATGCADVDDWVAMQPFYPLPSVCMDASQTPATMANLEALEARLLTKLA